MDRLVKWTVTVALAICAHSAVAANSNQVSFRIGAVDILWRLPSEYCPREGEAAAKAQAVAALDNDNITDLDIVSCADGKTNTDHYVILKTPNALIFPAIDRSEYLHSVADYVEKANPSEWQPSLTDDDDAAKRFESIFGSKATFKSTIKPISKDDICVYLGGFVDTASSKGQRRGAVMACMTIVLRKALTVYVYDMRTDASGMPKLLREAHKIAADIIGQNEK